MKIPTPHWPRDAADAIAIQHALRAQVRLKNRFDRLELIAGIDCSYDIASNQSYAFIVLMRYTDLQPLATVRAELATEFPYIPGLLSFREIPVILEALKKLPHLPNLLMVDGQGVAHPRRLGIAAHLGILTDIPTIGVAKSKLVGHHTALAETKGSKSFLMDRGERIGTVVRSKANCLPLYISPGHAVDHDTAVTIVEHCLTRYRLPEPTRLADKISKNSKPHHPQAQLL